MHDALKNIERIDKLIFPLLQLQYPNLNAPDVRHNEKLKTYIAAIEATIDEGLKKTEEKLNFVEQFVTIFDKKIDTVIIDLKKKTFILQNE